MQNTITLFTNQDKERLSSLVDLIVKDKCSIVQQYELLNLCKKYANSTLKRSICEY